MKNNPNTKGTVQSLEQLRDSSIEKSSKNDVRKSRIPAPLRIFGRVMTVFLLVILILLFTVLSAIFVLVKGPSPTAKRLFVLSVKETSAAGFLADIFLSRDEVDSIMNAQSESVSGTSGTTDKNLINIPKHDDETSDPDETADPDGTDGEGLTTEAPETDSVGSSAGREDGIVIDYFKRSTFNGVVMKISDPSRVILGIPDAYGETEVGLTLREMAAKYDAIGGINAGGFYDPGGSGMGGIPDGLVINEGELVWGYINGYYNVIGFDGDGVLHVGNMTAKAALELGIRYACSFGPTLVVNGEPVNNLGGGMNPRTVIGQCADGTVLMVVINGRSLGSLGATYDDITDLMIELGAVNAANLDGGSSSLLLYEGEFLNTSASLIGERFLPTTFLVK